jgi:hypothetical protein
VPAAGPSSEPAHDSDILGRQLGTRGEVASSGGGKDQSLRSVWDVGMKVPAFRRSPIAQRGYPSQRTESWEVCWILKSFAVVQVGKLRPKKEGTSPGSHN